MLSLSKDENFCVVDNYISNEVSQMIYDLLTDPSFPWFYNSSTIHDSSKDDEVYYDGPQFTHLFIKNKTIVSEYATTIAFLTKLHKKNILRLKANHQLNNFRSGISHFPHIDDETESQNLINGIIFIHETDGDTLIFEGDQSHRISPKVGRAIFMKGDVLHASNSPLKTPNRVVLNVNIYKE
jgi:hypothetical protein